LSTWLLIKIYFIAILETIPISIWPGRHYWNYFIKEIHSMDKLVEAFAEKEKAEIYLFNLDKLKEEDSIEENFHNTLKTEYLKIRDQAISKIDSIKAEIQKNLDARMHELAVNKLNFKYMEIRHKVGELSDSSFNNKSKDPLRKIENLEKIVKEFKTLVNSTGTTDIRPTPVKKFNLGADMLKKELPKVQETPDIVTKKTDAEGILIDSAKTMTIEPINIPESAPLTEPASIFEEKPSTKQIMPAELSIINLQILPNRVISGNHVGIIAEVKNIGQQEISYKLELRINNEIKDTKDISLLPGITEEVTFVILTILPGEYQVGLDGQSGEYQVLPY
jgi:hypothetical protein